MVLCFSVLVIDDDGKDDTWSYIREAAARYPGLVSALRRPRNKGKREALARGLARARGDVLVTIDSDSGAAMRLPPYARAAG